VSVTPYQSPSDPNPITPSSSNSGGGGSIPSNAEVPQLFITVATAPDITPDPTGGSSSTTTPTTPVTADFTIDLGSLREGEDGMINASSEIIDGYNMINLLFQGVKDTVFGQNATDTSQQTYDPTGDQDSSTTTVADPIQAAATAFANGQNGQPGINDIQAYALQQVANAMAMVGEYIAMLNAAGWSYAQADASSTLPSTQASSSSSSSSSS
jgi:hypothetical protein